MSSSSVSKGMMVTTGEHEATRWGFRLLLEMGCVKLKGRRRTPGRPVTYATADKFLEHFSLASLYDLPGVQEMKAAGLLDLSIPVGFEVPDPTRSSDEDETPLLPGEDDGPEFAQDFVSED